MTKFITDRILNPAGDTPSFEEWVNKFLDKEAAGEAKPECEGDTTSQCEGQVISDKGEAGEGHQTGESVSGKEAQGGNARPDTGGTTDTQHTEQVDKGGSAESKTKVAAEEDEDTAEEKAEEVKGPKKLNEVMEETKSDEEKKEVLKELREDKKEASCGKEMGESDDAGAVTDKHTEAGPGNDENPEPKVLVNNDPNYQKGESTDPGKLTGKNKKSELVNRFRKIASMDRLGKLVLFASLSANKDYPIEYVEAMTGLKFANMTEEEKAWFKDYWLTMYPPDYVDELAADR